MSTAIGSSELDFNEVLRAGDVIAWPQGTGEPAGLTRRLMAQRHALPAIGLFVGMCTSKTLLPDQAGRFQFKGLNGAGSNRRLTAAGVLDIIPVHVSTVPGLIRSRAIPVDVVLIRARPHPKPGYFTVGVVADYTQSLIAAARCVIAELDDRLPITSQDALVSRDAVDMLVSCDTDEILLADPEPSPVDVRVAEQVAGIIPDRATVQLGIGNLPVAVCRALSGHSDLGIHSGVISDTVVDLLEQGVVTNVYKGIDSGRTVTGCLFGGRRLMDFADGNPELEMRSVDYTHNIRVMAEVRNLYSVNSAIEVDLTGQVNAEVAGGRYLGAIGGQVDFVRGAQASPGGRSIIALPSTTPDGKRSRIVASLEGRPVTTGRADADLIVTEYGIADLKGRSLLERAARLAAIAHPDFRDELRVLRVHHA